ncbi:MAG: ROK family protein [Candidatus Ornithomonoglobus sp.]
MKIGIDLGGTNIAAGLVDDEYKIIAKASIPTLADRPIREVIDDIGDICKLLVHGEGMTMENIESVGIGCPGTIDHKNGIVVYSNNIRMENIRLREELQKRLDKPVSVENDANAAAMGEYVVNGDGADSFVFVTLGTGVGGGVIINGRLYRGFNGAGGELGHIIINTNGDEQCTCGNKGCWEAYASVTALIRQTKAAMRANSTSIMNEWAQNNNEISGRTAFECAKAGDIAAQNVVDQYIKYVGAGLISVLNIFQPKLLLIGGGISKEGEYLLKPLRDYVYAGDYNKFMPKTEIKAASLFNDAGIIGAALAANE